MATQVLNDVAVALTKQFHPHLQRQFNRLSVTADLLPKKNGAGQNVQWGVRFSRTTHAGPFTEGSDVDPSEINQDKDDTAALAWGQYRVAFGVSGLTLAAAASSLGSPDDLLELFQGHLMDASSDLISIINKDLWDGTGSGSPKPITGLLGGGILASSGTYAGLAAATYAEWKANVLANGGVGRPLTKSLLDQLEEQCYEACSLPPTIIIASSAVIRKYESLFDQVVRTAPAGTPGGGGELSVIGRLQANSGYTGLFYKGIPVVRDRNHTKTATLGGLSMLNTEFIDIASLPFVEPDMATTPSGQQVNLNDGAAGPVGINAKVEPLAKTGDANKFQLVSYIELRCRRRNAQGHIADIDIT